MLKPCINVCSKCKHLRYDEVKGVKKFLFFFEREVTACVNYSCHFASDCPDADCRWRLWTDFTEKIDMDFDGVPDICPYILEHVVSQDENPASKV